MRLLLDTHALLWFLLKDSKLSRSAYEYIADSDNAVLVSPASYWEIAIKISLGRYSLDEDFREFLEEQMTINQFAVLPISVEHAAVVATLPFHHRDPFDRMIIAQAIAEQVPVVSADAAFDAYPVQRLW